MISHILKETVKREKLNLITKADKLKILKEAKDSLSLKDKVFLSRYQNRPKAKDFIENIIENPIYFHGDRKFSDDKCILGGIGKLGNIPVTFIGIDKGSDLTNSIEKKFGMATPDGYRKAIRLMKQAEKFKRPVLTFVDTPGAYPGIEAEERGQAEAIASSILNMTSLKTPIISTIIGEGCSGGAIGLCVCDYLIMMENATYSILSPEGFSSILWKDSNKIDDALPLMKLTSQYLYEFKICDEIIPEDLVSEKSEFSKNYQRLRISLLKTLNLLCKDNIETILEKRKRKYEI